MKHKKNNILKNNDSNNIDNVVLEFKIPDDEYYNERLINFNETEKLKIYYHYKYYC